MRKQSMQASDLPGHVGDISKQSMQASDLLGHVGDIRKHILAYFFVVRMVQSSLLTEVFQN